jgi:hypothetical protein
MGHPTRCLDGDYDLLISDVNMSIMDGLTMLRHLRARDRKIPSVIFVSGFHGVTAGGDEGSGDKRVFGEAGSEEGVLGGR